MARHDPMTRALRVFALFALLAVAGITTGSAFAADTATSSEAVVDPTGEIVRESVAEVEGEGHGGGGMPQLEGETYASQIFWLILSFLALYYLLKNKGLPRVADILETRQERIATDLDRAARLRGEAEEAMKRHEAVVAEAQLASQNRLREAQDKLNADLARRQAKLDGELAGKLQEADRRIGGAKTQALTQIADVAAEVVEAAMQRLAGIEVTPEEARGAVDRELAEARS